MIRPAGAADWPALRELLVQRLLAGNLRGRRAHAFYERCGFEKTSYKLVYRL